MTRIEFVLTTEFKHILINETYSFICLCVVKGIVLCDVVGDKTGCCNPIVKFAQFFSLNNA